MVSTEKSSRSRLFLVNGLIWLFICLGYIALALRSKLALEDSNLLVIAVPVLVISVASHFLFMMLFKRNVSRIENLNAMSKGTVMDTWSAIAVLALLFLVIVLNPVNQTWTYLMTVVCAGIGIAAIEPAVRYLRRVK